MMEIPQNGDSPHKWFGGVLGPVLLVGWAIYLFAGGQVTIPGRHRGRLELTGFDAALFGAALCGLALVLHAHFFLTSIESYRGYDYESLGKLAGLVVIISAIFWLTARQFMQFI